MRALLFALVAIVALLGNASSAACTPTSSAYDEAIDTPAGLAYVVVPHACFDLKHCEPCGGAGPCVDYGGAFVESNGIVGLQRAHDERCGAPADLDPMQRDTLDWPMDD